MLLVDGLEIEEPGAGWYVCALGRQGDLAQQVPVESTEYGPSARIEDALARTAASIGHVDLAAVFVAEADRDDANAELRRRAGGVEGKRILVLSIRDQEDCARRIARRAEARQRLADRLFESRSAARRAVHPDPVENQAQKAEVGGHGREDAGASREGDDPHLVSVQVGQQIRDLGLGALEPVGRDVFREHRAGDIEADHDLGPEGLGRDVAHAPLGAHQRQDEEHRREREQDDPQATAPGARKIDEARLECRRDEAVERTAAALLEPDQQADEDREGIEGVGPGGLGKAELAHGSLRRKLPPRAPDDAIRSNATATKPG